MVFNPKRMNLCRPCLAKGQEWIIETDQMNTFTATRYEDKPLYARLENLKPWIWGLNKQPCFDFRALSQMVLFTLPDIC